MNVLTQLNGARVDRLAVDDNSDTVKVFNLVKTIARAFEERLKSAQEAVAELERLVG